MFIPVLWFSPNDILVFPIPKIEPGPPPYSKTLIDELGENVFPYHKSKSLFWKVAILLKALKSNEGRFDVWANGFNPGVKGLLVIVF